METRKLPVGIQSFETIRNGSADYLYVDKTELIFKLVSTDTPVFLSRPRRFGKSLLVSTMQAYFEGRKELFKGLAMETLEKDWTVYPVFKFDLSIVKNAELDNLHYALNSMLAEYEGRFSISDNSTSYGGRLNNLIKKAHQETDEKVVILIDEYDAPMLDAIGDEDKQSVIRNIIRDFFSPLKAQADHLRFVFLTGITKFSQLSIFSELNNLMNISMDDEFSAICGISKTELLRDMQPEIAALAKANEETYDEACEHLRQQYDGYHFSANGEDVFNPFSIVNVLTKKRYENFWFASGTPTFLLELMQANKMEILDLKDLNLPIEGFDIPTDFNPEPLATLYQSGYLTIKGYDNFSKTYHLDFPNYEVKGGFSDCLIKFYGKEYSSKRFALASCFFKHLKEDNVDAFMTEMKNFLLGFPYNLGDDCSEKHYQSIIYATLYAIGMNVNAEIAVAQGRLDMSVCFPQSIFIFEFKLDKSAQEALDQINEKNYAAAFATDQRKIIKIGANFSTQTRTLDEWVVEK